MPHYWRWLVAAGFVAGALLTYAGQRGGLGLVVQEVRDAVGLADEPRIVAIQPTRRDPTTFNVAVENPSLRRIHVTAYYGVSLVILSPAEEFDVNTATLSTLEATGEPIACNVVPHRFPLEKPVVLEPNSTTLLTVKPFVEECEFSLVLETSAGTSSEAFFAPRHVAYLRQLDEDQRRDELKDRGKAFAEYYKRQSAAPDFLMSEGR